MNYADFGLGTWHPEEVCTVLLRNEKVAEDLGVHFTTEANVEKIHVTENKVSGIRVNGKTLIQI